MICYLLMFDETGTCKVGVSDDMKNRVVALKTDDGWPRRNSLLINGPEKFVRELEKKLKIIGNEENHKRGIELPRQRPRSEYFDASYYRLFERAMLEAYLKFPNTSQLKIDTWSSEMHRILFDMEGDFLRLKQLWADVYRLISYIRQTYTRGS